MAYVRARKHIGHLNIDAWHACERLVAPWCACAFGFSPEASMSLWIKGAYKNAVASKRRGELLSMLVSFLCIHLIYFLYMVDMLVFKFLWAMFCPYTEASVNIVGFADFWKNIKIRFHHDDWRLGSLAPHRQGVAIERHDLCRHQSLLPSHCRMQNMWEDGWQIIGVQWMRFSFWRNCKLPKNDGEHAHACSDSRSNINDMAEVHGSILFRIGDPEERDSALSRTHFVLYMCKCAWWKYLPFLCWFFLFL